MPSFSLTAGTGSSLYIHDGAGGLLFVTKTAVDGTEQTVIPDGPGDVVRGCQYAGVARGSSGTLVFITMEDLTTPGAGSVTRVLDGAGDITIKLYATGQLVVYRSAGAETWSISLNLIWQ